MVSWERLKCYGVACLQSFFWEDTISSCSRRYKKKFKKIKNIDPVLEKNLINLNRQFLHAKTLGFIHPTKNKEMIFNSILPQELEKILKTLRNIAK